MKRPSDDPAPAASRGHEPTELLRLTPSYGDPDPDDAGDWDEDEQEDDDQDDEDDEDDDEEEPEWYVASGQALDLPPSGSVHWMATQGQAPT